MQWMFPPNINLPWSTFWKKLYLFSQYVTWKSSDVFSLQVSRRRLERAMSDTNGSVKDIRGEMFGLCQGSFYSINCMCLFPVHAGWAIEQTIRCTDGTMWRTSVEGLSMDPRSISKSRMPSVVSGSAPPSSWISTFQNAFKWNISTATTPSSAPSWSTGVHASIAVHYPSIHFHMNIYVLFPKLPHTHGRWHLQALLEGCYQWCFGQWCTFSRSIGEITPKIICFYYQVFIINICRIKVSKNTWSDFEKDFPGYGPPWHDVVKQAHRLLLKAVVGGCVKGSSPKVIMFQILIVDTIIFLWKKNSLNGLVCEELTILQDEFIVSSATFHALVTSILSRLTGLCYVWPVSIQTNAFLARLRQKRKKHREQTLCPSVCKIKVL